MKIKILVKANAKKDLVVKSGLNQLTVWLKAPPKEGKANHRLLAVLADHFSIPRSSVLLKSGLRSKHKIVEVIC